MSQRAVAGSPASTPVESFYGWRLVGVLWLIFFVNMGFPLYGGAVINSYMLKQIPMPRSEFGLGFTLLNFFIGVPATLVAFSIQKWGVRKTFAIGSGLIFLGALWMAFIASTPWQYLVGFGVLIGSGIGFGTIVPLSTLVTRWFRRFRGRAMAIAMTASGFAGLACAPLMNWVLAISGRWQVAWEIVALAAAASLLIALFGVRERPEDLGQHVDGGSNASAAQTAVSNPLVTKEEWTPKEAYRTTPFWMIVIGSVVCQYPFFFFTAHWIVDLVGSGISAADAALAMGIFTMGVIVGSIIGGWLMDKIPARYAFMIGILCYLAGSVMAIGVTAASLPRAFTAAILYGTAFGCTFVCLNTMTGNFYGAKAFHKPNGVVMLLSALASSPAGLVGGMLFDAFKSYKPAFELNIALCLVGLIALAFAIMPSRELLRRPEA
jgi:MFS family permease